MDNNNLSRYEFLKAMGFRGAALMAVLTSCVNEDDKFIDAATVNSNGEEVSPTTTSGGTTNTGSSGSTNSGTTKTGSGTSQNLTTEQLNAITNALIKIDLSSSSAQALKKVGGYIISNNVVLAQVSAGSYAAVQNLCTHEPKKRIIFNKTEWYCTDHGARFNTVTGSPLNNVARKAIVTYKVATDGKTVVVYT